MRKGIGWEHLTEISRLIQVFRHMYVHGDSEDEDTVLKWRADVRRFFTGLLSSCRSSAAGGVEEDAGTWLHFQFDSFCSVLTHSCCDWSSREAFGCGLMAEVIELLIELQSELPVCSPAILHVLLHRLAALRPGKEAKGQFAALTAALQQVLEACPAMPAAAMERSVEDCLRRPSPGATWSFGALSMFVQGVLSLVAQFPRALSPSVVPLLVRFVSETSCRDDGCDLDPMLATTRDNGEGRLRGSPCVCCVAAGAPIDSAHGSDLEKAQRCELQERRDVVLEALMRWIVDAHFRRCSRSLQLSVHRTVCDGVQQALHAAANASLSASPPCFPLPCRLLLAFVGGLAGDGGVQVAAFLQRRCSDELRHFLARLTCCRAVGSVSSRAAVAANAGVEHEFPVLQAYIGHLYLCRHVSDTTASTHLLWLTRQALAIFRLLETTRVGGGSGASARANHTRLHADAMIALSSLCHSVALLLTRSNRQKEAPCEGVVIGSAGNLLEIILDSDVRPLSALPRTLAAAAVDVLQDAGHLQLARLDALLGPCPSRPSQQHLGKADDVTLLSEQDGVVSGPCKDRFTDGVEFAQGRVAFQKSWELVEAGVEQSLPPPRLSSKMKRRIAGESWCDTEDLSCDLVESDEGHADVGHPGSMENGWEHVPEEVALRVFSFLTPKRICRLACVERTWRDLLRTARVWRPFCEARWPMTMLEGEEEQTTVSAALLELRTEGSSRHKRKRAALVQGSHVYHWGSLEDSSETTPTLDWMALYRDRHRAECAARGRRAAKSGFSWRVCPFLGCVTSLRSEYAVKRHIQAHKRPQARRCMGKKALARKQQDKATAAAGRQGKKRRSTS